MSVKEFSLIAHLKKSNRKLNLYEPYRGLERLFHENIHPYVTSLANAKDHMFLTDHGSEHISELILKANKLFTQSGELPSHHETFLLLVAIHLHDIGNALGRRDHEQNAGELWKLVYGPLGFDEWDMLLAQDIARVHGGKINGNSDTIASLEESVVWRGVEIRKQYLAALLKLADEMAETRSRANRVGLELNAIPKPSEIYHIYARGIESIECDSKSCTIKIDFKYRETDFSLKFGKGDKEVYLLDEIYERTQKTYTEALYCSRYFRGRLRFDRVSVRVKIYDKDLKECKLSIDYPLEQRGYSALPSTAIFTLAPELADFKGGGKLTAKRLSSLLNPPKRGNPK